VGLLFPKQARYQTAPYPATVDRTLAQNKSPVQHCPARKAKIIFNFNQNPLNKCIFSITRIKKAPAGAFSKDIYTH
jgi:hypothetical protein